LSKLFTP